MTLEEANLFFPCDDIEDIEELYEERLFEYKQFFLSKPIISKVYQAKLSKLMKMHEAFLVISGLGINHKIFSSPHSEFKTSNLKELFDLFQSERNKWKILIQNSRDAIDLKSCVYDVIEMHQKYMQKWPIFDLENNESISVSIEPDVMQMLKAIKEVNELGYVSLVDVKRMQFDKTENNSIRMIVLEAKRLSLLRKLEGNE